MSIQKNLGVVACALALVSLVGAGCASKKTVTATTYTIVDVAQHANAGDCWYAVSGKVYNVTDYMQRHPAGVAILLKHCGTDATQAYNTMGGRGRDHSVEADMDLETYFIGNLVAE